MCNKHYLRYRAAGGKVGWPTEDERLWGYVDKNGPLAALRPDLGKCWLWTGGLGIHGYGKFYLSRHGGRPRPTKAHRVIYETVKGAIPDGLSLDHFACERPACVNPDHVRPASHRENCLRGHGPPAWNLAKTHCIAGHEFTPANTHIDKHGYRRCRICARRRERDRQARLKAQRT